MKPRPWAAGEVQKLAAEGRFAELRARLLEHVRACPGVVDKLTAAERRSLVRIEMEHVLDRLNDRD